MFFRILCNLKEKFGGFYKTTQMYCFELFETISFALRWLVILPQILSGEKNPGLKKDQMR